MPGLRLFEHYRRTVGDHDSATFKFGAVGYKMLEFLSPARITAKYYSVKKTAAVLGHLIEYVKLTADNVRFSEIDAIYLAAYEQLKLLKSTRQDRVLRSDKRSTNFHFSKFFQNLAVISKVESVTPSGSAATFQQICMEDSMLPKLEAFKAPPSLNVLSAMTVICGVDVLRKSKQSDDVLPITPVLALSGYYLLFSSLLELDKFFDGPSESTKLLRDLLAHEFGKLKGEMSKEYPLPTLGNVTYLEPMIERLATRTKEYAARIQYTDAPQLFRVYGVQFAPNYTLDERAARVEFVAKRFGDISVRFDIHERSPVRHARKMLKRYISKFSTDFEEKTFDQPLRRVLSPLHSWRWDSHTDVGDAGFVTIDGNRKKMIFNSVPKGHLFFPRNFHTTPKIVNAIFTGTLILLLLSLGGCLFKFGSERIGKSIVGADSNEEHLQGTVPQVETLDVDTSN